MQLGTEQTGTAVNHCHHIQLCPQLFPRLQAERAGVQTKQHARTPAALFHQPVEHLQVLIDPAAALQRALVELRDRHTVACGDLLVEVGNLRGGEGTQGKQRAEGEEGAAHQHCSRASQPEPAVGLSSLPRPISCGLALYSS